MIKCGVLSEGVKSWKSCYFESQGRDEDGAQLCQIAIEGFRIQNTGDGAGPGDEVNVTKERLGRNM